MFFDYLSMDITRRSVTLSENSTVSLNLVSEIKAIMRV